MWSLRSWGLFIWDGRWIWKEGLGVERQASLRKSPFFWVFLPTSFKCMDREIFQIGSGDIAKMGTAICEEIMFPIRKVIILRSCWRRLPMEGFMWWMRGP